MFLHRDRPHQGIKVVFRNKPSPWLLPLLSDSSSSSPLLGWQRWRQRSEPRHHTAVQHLFWKSCSTTDESASVEMSPRSRSSQAILRRTRRMILPARGRETDVTIRREPEEPYDVEEKKNKTEWRRGGANGCFSWPPGGDRGVLRYDQTAGMNHLIPGVF